MLSHVFKWLHLQKILGGPRSAIPYNEGRVNEDATRGQKGWAIRDRAFLVSTPQRYGTLSIVDLFRDPKAWAALFVGMVLEHFAGDFLSYMTVDWIVMKLTFSVVAIRMLPRLWYLWPMVWSEGARHVLVLFQAAGYWHRAEFIRGKGEVVQVLTDSNGPVPSTIGAMNLRSMIEGNHVLWGEQDTEDEPREAIRLIRTYRRRPTWNLPVMFYGRTSVGFASHMLGIRNPKIRTPQELMDYCEKDATWDETVDTQMRAPEARGGYG